MKALALAIAVLVSGCGGQVTAKPVNICMQPSDRLEVMRGCDATVWTINEPNLVPLCGTIYEPLVTPN